MKYLVRSRIKGEIGSTWEVFETKEDMLDRVKALKRSPEVQAFEAGLFIPEEI